MGLKASISVISQLPTFHNPHKKKIKSPPQSHRPQLHTTPSLLFKPFTSFSLSLSLYPLALATIATTSNQTKSFTFPSLALIRSAPRLHSFKLFTSLSLFLSTRWQQQLVGYFKVQIKLRFSLSHVSSSGHES